MSLKKTVPASLKSKGKKVKSKGKSEKTSAKSSKKAKPSANRQNSTSPAGTKKKPQSPKSKPQKSQPKAQPKSQTKGIAKTQAETKNQAQPTQPAPIANKGSSKDKPLKAGLKKVVAPTTAHKEKPIQDKSSDKVLPKKQKKMSEKKLTAYKKQLQENEKKWDSFYKKAKGIKPLPFAISREFPAKTPINHSLFGWGWVISNKNDRLEVIFKDKVRKLLSNRLDGKKSSW